MKPVFLKKTGFKKLQRISSQTKPGFVAKRSPNFQRFFLLKTLRADG
ncbi:hypothetical protein H6F77_22525 [Microcoleus sp. FACHB-831]|nr:hypothetical protein [Microcoleus sp. FACHB-831]MBD1923820.1 hypothetical protein [Microcoleus sp. FACHB-831]